MKLAWYSVIKYLTNACCNNESFAKVYGNFKCNALANLGILVVRSSQKVCPIQQWQEILCPVDTRVTRNVKRTSISVKISEVFHLANRGQTGNATRCQVQSVRMTLARTVSQVVKIEPVALTLCQDCRYSGDRVTERLPNLLLLLLKLASTLCLSLDLLIPCVCFKATLNNEGPPAISGRINVNCNGKSSF